MANAELAQRSRRVVWVYFFLAIIMPYMTELYRHEPAASAIYAGITFVVGYLRTRNARRFSRVYGTDPSRWLTSFSILSTIQSLSMGIALPVVFFSQGAGWAFAISLMCFTGISAGAASSLAPQPRVHSAFQWTLLGPIGLTLLLFGDNRLQALSVLVFLWILQNVMLGRYLHRQFRSGLQAQRQLRLRAEALEKAKRTAEEAMRVKGDILANTSHEIHGIIGMTDLVLESDLTDEQREQLADVKSSGETLLTIINEILDFSKLEAGQAVLETAPFSLAETIDKVARPLHYLAQSRGNKLIVELEPNLPARLMGDSHRLWQILTNIASNAVKFTEEGQITIRARALDSTADPCPVELMLSDTGIGIAPAAQETVFQAFSQADSSTTRRYGGTGLGLAITKKLVDLMGGEIQLDSAVGQGSTFTIRLDLPVAPAESGSRPRTAPATETGNLEGLRVLLAEDNSVNAKLVHRVLGKSGIVVDWAENGQQALDAWQKGGHDLILMDVQMPVMDGFQATVRGLSAEMPGPRHG